MDFYFQEPYPHHNLSEDDIAVMKTQCEPFFGIKSPETFFVASATLCVYSSNKMEQVGANRTETAKIINQWIRDPSSYDTKLDNKQREVLQHFRVLQTIFTAANSKIMLTESLINSWHAQLMEGLIDDGAGEYRSDGVFAGQKIFPNPDLVPSLMSGLLSTLQEKINAATLSPYALAAWLSHAFVSIHPFCDGNGRMCRLLSNYILWWFGFPFAIATSSDRKKYIEALRYADRDFIGPRRVGMLASLILKQAHAIVINYLANENLAEEFKPDKTLESTTILI